MGGVICGERRVFRPFLLGPFIAGLATIPLAQCHIARPTLTLTLSILESLPLILKFYTRSNPHKPTQPLPFRPSPCPIVSRWSPILDLLVPLLLAEARCLRPALQLTFTNDIASLLIDACRPRSVLQINYQYQRLSYSGYL